MSDIRTRILTFAIVQQNFGRSRDPIVALAPFLAPIAADLHGEDFDASTFRDEMKGRYGIALSRDVTEVFIQRLLSLGFLVRSDSQIRWARQPGETSGQSNATSQRLDEVLVLAAKFYAERADLISEEFDEESFLEALISVLLNQNTPLSAAVAAIESATGVDATVSPARSRSSHEYFASEFISWASKNKKNVFEWLADLSGTALVLESLIDVRTPANKRPIKPDLSVYLDTPVLMELLGCSGTAAREDSLLLANTLKEQKIPVCVMKHSLNELRRNLGAVLHTSPEGRVGPTAKALLYREVTEAYLKSVYEHPDQFIQQHGLQLIDPKKLVHLADEQCFTDMDAQNFYAMIFSLHDKNEPRQHDVDSISWIMRRRKGEMSSDILRSKHILLTRNDQLVRSATRIARQRADYSLRDWGPATSVRDLAGVMWLIVGQAERSEISKRQLILSCDRARSSAPQIIGGMLATLRSVDPRNADLLWAAIQIPTYLSMAMDATAYSVESGTTDASSLTLTKIRDDLIADERAKSANRMAREREKSDAEAELAKIAMASLVREKSEIEAKSELLLRRFRDLSLVEWKKCRFWARIVLVSLTYGVEAILMCFVALGAVLSTDAVQVHWVLNAVVALIVSGVLFYVSKDKLERYLREKVERHYRSKYEKRVEKLTGTVASEVLNFNPFLVDRS